MTDDLPARLLAIADDYQSAGCEGPHESTIREAAAALQQKETAVPGLFTQMNLGNEPRVPDVKSDDLLTRMRSASSLGAAIKALDEGADRIELLEGLLREARDFVPVRRVVFGSPITDL